LADLTQDELYKRHISGHHFLDENFTSINKCKLKKSSIPQPFVEIDNDDIPVNIPLKTYSTTKKFPSSPHQVIEIKRTQSTSTTSFCELTKRILLLTPVKSTKFSSSQSNVSTPEMSPNTSSFFQSVSKLSLTSSLKPIQLFTKSTSDADLILKLKKIITRKRVTISKLKKVYSCQEYNTSKQILKFYELIIINSRTLVHMEISHSTFKPWSLKEKQFALSLFYKSLSAYEFLFYSKQISFPSLSSIRRRIGSSKCRTGFVIALFYLNN